jgi:hypothetical protein
MFSVRPSRIRLEEIQDRSAGLNYVVWEQKILIGVTGTRRHTLTLHVHGRNTTSRSERFQARNSYCNDLEIQQHLMNVFKFDAPLSQMKLEYVRK